MELVGVSLGVEMTLKLEHVGNKTRPGREMETGKALSDDSPVVITQGRGLTETDGQMS